MTEGERLDALTLEEAKGILHQIGYFAEETLFFSLRFTAHQLEIIAGTEFGRTGSTEELIVEALEELGDEITADQNHGTLPKACELGGDPRDSL